MDFNKKAQDKKIYIHMWIWSFYNISAEFFIYLILCVIYYLRILIKVYDIFAFHKKKEHATTHLNNAYISFYFLFL